MSNSIDFHEGPGGQYEAYEDSTNLGIGSSGVPFIDRGLPARHAEYMDTIMPDLLEMEADYEAALQQLNDKIDSMPPGRARQELKAARDELKETWREITHHPPGGHRDIGDFTEKWETRMDNMRDAVGDAYDAVLGQSQMRAEPQAEVQASGTFEAPPATSSESTTEAESTSGSSEAEAADSTEGSSKSEGGGASKSIDDVDINSLMNRMASDPQGVMEELKGLSQEDRGLVMNMMTQQMQLINQMISMMSNMQKAQHDTAKAAINNMRV